MSISKAFNDLDTAGQFEFAQCFLNPPVMEVMGKTIAWSKEQLATLDPDSEDFKSEYRRISTMIAVLNELINLSKSEKINEQARNAVNESPDTNG